MHKGLCSALESVRATMARPRCAPMATMDTTHTRALHTATTVPVGSPAASLSALARGSTGTMADAASTADAASPAVAALPDAVASLMAADSAAAQVASVAAQVASVAAQVASVAEV